MYEREAIDRGVEEEGKLKRTRLSQKAISLGFHLNRTWKSTLWAICSKRNLRMESDSALGTPTIRRVNPESSNSQVRIESSRLKQTWSHIPGLT